MRFGVKFLFEREHMVMHILRIKEHESTPWCFSIKKGSLGLD